MSKNWHRYVPKIKSVLRYVASIASFKFAPHFHHKYPVFGISKIQTFVSVSQTMYFAFKILNVFQPISILLFPTGDIFDQLIRSHLGGFHPFIGKYVSLSRPERFDLAAGTKLSNWNWRKFQMWRDCIDCPIEKVLQVDQDEYCSFRDKKRQMLSKAGIWRRMANVSDLPSLSANSTATKRRHL